MFDDLTVVTRTSDYRLNYIDDIQVDIEFGVTNGIGSPTTYNGENGVISMSFGYGIRCVEGYMGNDCSTLSPMDCSTCNTTMTECPVCSNTSKYIYSLNSWESNHRDGLMGHKNIYI